MSDREIDARAVALRALTTGYRELLSEAVGALLRIETECTTKEECVRTARDALDALETDRSPEA